ncbi:GNAT family N-acetyltransferase [Nocardia sp. CDC159]|uniref:GNAT family N-acetyltransferase n=1 Tax=Nocardia pulmonis TaxID=2951408 RepID=A0A9X2IVZ0_9NOCA|nr:MULTISPECIES: N-acetyltransferase [Nocardia]MCM6772300.1 GNAT family N-acetyltransferase [Nocardia pulmonis]MCM6785042.1 GNAT family N-acetyltransferase [Nocardia sp. CDC159]
MAIRPGTHRDAESVAALHTRSWRTAYVGIMPDEYLNGPLLEDRLALWRDRLAGDRSDGQLFVLDGAAELLGFVYLLPRFDGRILLDNLHVRPDVKRGGIGGRLLRHGLAWAATTHPGRPVYLEVLRANTPAITFYERHGGRRTGERVAHFPQGFALPELEYTWAPAAFGSP